MTKKANETEANSAIDSAPTEPSEDAPTNEVEEGQVLETTTHDGERVSEKIVFDYDDNGDQIGWHKEVVA